MPKKPPTQADVAKLAGVSRPMVSYVLNNSSPISIPDETRQRIMQAVETLGYVPDRTAQSLRMRKSFTLASIIPDITNPFYPSFERGIQDIARNNNYDLVVYNTDGHPEQERKSLQWVQQGRVDGVITTLFYSSLSDLIPLLERQIHVVRMGVGAIDLHEQPIDNLYVDNVAAAQAAVDYLVERGHTRIGMIAGQETPPRETRVHGYKNALTKHNIPANNLLVRSTDFTEEGGYDAMHELLKLPSRPTAVFAANDLMAIGAMMALREAGLRIPQDMAVIGFDDIPAARLVNPSLTTIAQFPENLGRRAAEMLFERLGITAQIPGRNEEMPFQLIVRESA
jgi:LacI family transcriptional regulator